MLPHPLKSFIQLSQNSRKIWFYNSINTPQNETIFILTKRNPIHSQNIRNFRTFRIINRHHKTSNIKSSANLSSSHLVARFVISVALPSRQPLLLPPIVQPRLFSLLDHLQIIIEHGVRPLQNFGGLLQFDMAEELCLLVERVLVLVIGVPFSISIIIITLYGEVVGLPGVLPLLGGNS